MDLKPSRRWTRGAWAVLFVALAATAIDLWSLQSARSLNRLIEQQIDPQQSAASDTPAAPLGESARPELRFARAYALAAQAQDSAASAAAEASLSGYRALQADSPLGQAARFNAANALLRQAQQLREAEQVGQSIALIELAKETYRDVLRFDSRYWDARYNLERAQRLLPDPDESEALPAQAPQGAERAATTMRGVSPGLP